MIKNESNTNKTDETDRKEKQRHTERVKRRQIGKTISKMFFHWFTLSFVNIAACDS